MDSSPVIPLSRYPNLKLLCRRDEKQKRSLERLAQSKPNLVKSLDIYAQHMDEYLKEQRRRVQYLKKRETNSIHQPQNLEIMINDPVIFNQYQRLRAKQNYLQQLKNKKQEHSPTQSLQHSKSSSVQHFDRNYTPLVRIDHFIIPSLQKVNPSPPREQKPIHYKFTFGINDDELVKQLLKKRQNWGEVPMSAFRHFHWRAEQGSFDYGMMVKQDLSSKRVMVNFLEFQSEITNITSLYQTILLNFGTNFKCSPGYILSFKVSNWKEEYRALQELAFPNQQVQLLGNLYVPHKPGLQNNVQQWALSKNHGEACNWMIRPQNIPIQNTVDLSSKLQALYQTKIPDSKEFVIQKTLDSQHLINNQPYFVHFWVLWNHENQVFIYDEYFGVQGESILEKATVGDRLEKAKRTLAQLFYTVKLNRRNRKYCMQIFEPVFQVDTDQELWLWEIRDRPNLSAPHSRDMLDEAFNLSLDQVFPPQEATKSGKWKSL